MKKRTTKFIKSKKILYNKQGQIIFRKSFLLKNVKRYYQFLSVKGS